MAHIIKEVTTVHRATANCWHVLLRDPNYDNETMLYDFSIEIVLYLDAEALALQAEVLDRGFHFIEGVTEAELAAIPSPVIADKMVGAIYKRLLTPMPHESEVDENGDPIETNVISNGLAMGAITLVGGVLVP